MDFGKWFVIGYVPFQSNGLFLGFLNILLFINLGLLLSPPSPEVFKLLGVRWKVSKKDLDGFTPDNLYTVCIEVIQFNNKTKL